MSGIAPLLFFTSRRAFAFCKFNNSKNSGIRVFYFIALAVLLSCFPSAYISSQDAGKFPPEFEKLLNSSPEDRKFNIIVVMSAKYTFPPYSVSVKEQRDYIRKKRLEELRTFSANDQKNLMEFLAAEEKSSKGSVSDIKTNAVKNLIALAATRKVIVEKLARRDDVAFIIPYDETYFSDDNVTDANLNIVDYSRDYQSALDRLKDANPLARRAAINYLGRLKNPDLVKPLVAALSDEDPLVRRTAVEALANFRNDNDKTVERAILDVLKKETDVSVKISAIRTAGELGSSVFFGETIKTLARDQFAIYRGESIKALAKLRPITESARRLIVASVSDEAEGVRIAAMEAASRNSFQEALPAIVANLSDPVALVRRSACEALGRLGTKSEHVALLEKIALNDAENSVRVEAANSAELIKSRIRSQSR